MTDSSTKWSPRVWRRHGLGKDVIWTQAYIFWTFAAGCADRASTARAKTANATADYLPVSLTAVAAVDGGGTSGERLRLNGQQRAFRSAGRADSVQGSSGRRRGMAGERMVRRRASEATAPRFEKESLESLISSLDVAVVQLLECVIVKGWTLQLTGPKYAGLHYSLTVRGVLLLEGFEAVALRPHTLVVVPPGLDFRIQVPGEHEATHELKMQDNRAPAPVTDGLRRHTAGDCPDLIMICGYFQTSNPLIGDLFARLEVPIVEQFDAADGLDDTLKSALSELVRQEVGFQTMATALLKLAVVKLLRRSLHSVDLWAAQLPMVRDPQLARAYSIMSTRPGEAHTLSSLSKTAGLSRSAFCARFTDVFGQPPMTLLRDLRMHEAAKALQRGMSIAQAAKEAGYTSRSSFQAAFKRSFGRDPSECSSEVQQMA